VARLVGSVFICKCEVRYRERDRCNFCGQCSAQHVPPPNVWRSAAGLPPKQARPERELPLTVPRC
jgi:hypothetical protein